MRLLLLAAAVLPLGAASFAGIANADHVGIGYNIYAWCSWLAPQESGCSHTETYSFKHIHMFGVTPKAGVSFPVGSVVTVTLRGTAAFTLQPFAQSHTCDLGLDVFTPQPSTPVGAVNGAVDRFLGDVSVHQSCGTGPVSFHRNFVGAITLTAQGGPGLHALVDAWVAM